MQYLLYLLVLFYFLYTLSYALKFNRANIYYAGKQKLVHNLMIWLVPFLWILLLKTIDRPIGRNSFSQEPETGPDGSDGGGPPDSIHFFMDPEVHRMEVTPAPTQVATITMDMTPVEVEIQVVVEMVGIRGGIAKAKHYTII
ncbi:MAG: hypothetical protein IPK08_03385 [Bacteroidetes bacterium]|nr:hypothetical protein [Bacteroidota bacterium]